MGFSTYKMLKTNLFDKMHFAFASLHSKYNMLDPQTDQNL